MSTYTNANGIIFNLGDHGKDGQYLRYCAWRDIFDGKLGETFKLVKNFRTKRERQDWMDARTA
jgi:hypothetical protein